MSNTSKVEEILEVIKNSDIPIQIEFDNKGNITSYGEVDKDSK